MSAFIWLNGTICPLAEARISPLDHGLLVGDGVFETLVARQGQPFAAREHWQRLVNSCRIMGMVPMPLEQYLAALEAVLKANELKDARLRVTLTTGDGPLGSDRGKGAKTALVTAVALKPWPATEKVCLVPWTLNENGPLAGAKSVSYGGNVRALALAKSQGCGEALMANTRGELCEGTGSNVFLVLRGRLVTPPLSSGCLPGITRGLVIKACQSSGIDCFEEPVPVSALDHCEEAFLTSSTRDVHPIAELDGRLLPTPGVLTQSVAVVFHQLAPDLVR
jgi:branched-chain amino acid aminotransferase